MRFNHVLTVWQKELLDTIRDRRSLIMIIVVPLVIMPVFVLGPSYLMRLQEVEQEQSAQEVVVQNGADAPHLLAAIQAAGGLKLVERTGAETALQNGKLALMVVVPPGFEEKLSKEEPTTLEIKFNPTKSESRTAREKFEALLRIYREQIIANRLQTLGVDLRLLDPFSADYQSVASKEQLGGVVLSFILPLFLIMWAAIGASQTAIDVTVGEKERQTLEALLATPTRRESLVLGKVLAIFSVAVVAALVSVLGFVLSLKYGAFFLGSGELRGFPLADLSVSFSPIVALIIVLVSAGVAAMMSALTFALFSWTRSVREAQSHTTWITFGVMIPALVVQLREFTPNVGSLLIPIFNATVVFKELLLGQLNWINVLVTLASSLVYAMISVWIAVRVFQNERVLFRQ